MIYDIEKFEHIPMNHENIEFFIGFNKRMKKAKPSSVKEWEVIFLDDMSHKVDFSQAMIDKFHEQIARWDHILDGRLLLPQRMMKKETMTL